VNPLAEVRSEWHGDVPVGAIHGEVDASNVADVGVELRGLVSNHSDQLVVDLTETTYLDSAGINLLFALGDELRSRQLTMRLVIPGETPIARMIAITGLNRVFSSYTSVADAVAVSS
jgi:anti-sigma B factor antagonist